MAFRELSSIHNDGWGVTLVSNPEQAAYQRDGGAPSPETGFALYRNTIAAQHDPLFTEFAQTPARGALWHLRLASSNLPLVLENQQPFHASSLSFIHNGDISDEQGRNITTNRAYPIDQNLVQSTGGRSDSAMYFAIMLQYLGYGYTLDEALAQAVRELRALYPNASYNCMIQSQDQFIALRAEYGGPTVQGVIDAYARHDRADEAVDYSVLQYRVLGENADDQSPRGVVVASTGFISNDDAAREGWKELENNHMIIASNRTGEFRIRAI